MKTRARVVVVSTVLCCALALANEAAADPAETMLQDGVVNFRVGKFKESIKVLKRARRKTKDPKILARIHLYLGMNYAVKKKHRKKARKAFKKALKLNPAMTMVGGDAKKSIVAMFEEVRQGMTGSLNVESTPSGAAVEIGGKVVGKTPYKGKLPVGKHHVRLRSEDGLERYEADLLVEHKKSYTIQGKLKFTGGKLSVTTKPEKAKVLLDGKEIGVTPIKDARVAAGDHELRLELAGHEPLTRKLELAEGGSVALELTLKVPPPVEPVKPPPVEPASQPKPLDMPKPEEGKTTGGRSVPIWTIIAGGAALAAAGAGIGLYMHSGSVADDYKEKLGAEKDNKKWEELEAEGSDKVKELDTGAFISFGVAGALAATAVVLFFLVDRPAMQESKAAVRVGPGGFAISFDF